MMAENDIEKSWYQKLDKDFTALNAEVSGLKVTVAGQGNRLVSIDDKLDKIITGRRTDWGVLGGWATALFTFFAGIGYLTVAPMQDDIKNNAVAIEKNRQDYHDHGIDGHPKRVEQRLDGIEAGIKHSQDAMYRHIETTMGPVTSEQDRLSNAVDKMIAYDAQQNSAIEDLTEDIKEIRSEQTRRSERVYGPLSAP